MLPFKAVRGHMPLKMLAEMLDISLSALRKIELGELPPTEKFVALYESLLAQRRTFTFVAEALQEATAVGVRTAYKKLKMDLEWSEHPHLLRDIRGTISLLKIAHELGCSEAVVYAFESVKPRVRISEEKLAKLLAKYAAVEAQGNTLTYDRDLPKYKPKKRYSKLWS